MKVKNKSILITDPCYVASVNKEWGHEFDYTNNQINTDKITDYMWDYTGFGDSSFSIEKIIDNVTSQQELTNYIEEVEEASYKFYEDATKENLKKLDSVLLRQKKIGDFSVDSGSFCVFLLEDIEKNYPGFFKQYKNHKVFSVINDFDGTVDIYTDSRKQNHIVGVGNISFYTNSKNY